MRTEASLFKNKPYKTLIYTMGVLLLGFMALSAAFYQSPPFLYKFRFEWLTFILFGAAHIFTERYSIPLERSKGQFSVSFVVILTALILFDIPVALLIGLISHGINTLLIEKRHWSIALFNVSQYAISYYAAGCVLNYVLLTTSTPFVYLSGWSSTIQYLVQLFLAGLFACLTYLVINIPLVNGYFAIQDSNTLKQFMGHLFDWRQDQAEIFQVLTFSPFAILVAYFYRIIPVFSILVLVPMVQSLIIHRINFRIEQQKARLEQLHKLTKELNEMGLNESQTTFLSRDIFKALLQSKTSRINDMMGSERCSIYRVERAEDDEDSRIIHETSFPGLLEPEKKYHWMDKGILQTVAKREKGILIPQYAPTETYVHWQEYQSLVIEPIKATDNALYLIVLFHSNARAFQAETQQLLGLLTQQLGVILKNNQLKNTIQEQAIKDGLMGVFNHRYLKQKMEEELSRAKRYKNPLSLIIADVDYFKKFNDTHGHLLGDKVLKEVAQILTKAVRDTDIVARYGGEELAILLPETTLTAACEVAERIRSNIAKHPFTGKDNQIVSLSVSIGVNCIDDDPNLQIAELIVRTDTALYKAKNQGRNQICKSVVEDGKLLIETYAKGESPKLPDTPPLQHPQMESAAVLAEETPTIAAESMRQLNHALLLLPQPDVHGSVVFYQALLKQAAQTLSLTQAALFYPLTTTGMSPSFTLAVYPDIQSPPSRPIGLLPQQLALVEPQILSMADVKQYLDMPNLAQSIGFDSNHVLLIPISFQGHLMAVLLGETASFDAKQSHLWPVFQALGAYAVSYQQKLALSADSWFAFMQALVEQWQQKYPSPKLDSQAVSALAYKVCLRIPNISPFIRENIRRMSYLISACDFQSTPLLQTMTTQIPHLNALMYLNEHWDGSGQPFGLKAEEIPLEASVLGLIMAYAQALYHNQMLPVEAIENLKKTGYYDPHLCDILEQVIQDDAPFTSA